MHRTAPSRSVRGLDRAHYNAMIRMAANGCWEWRGTRNRDGYGVTRANGKTERTHRIAWRLRFGEIQDNLCVCHKCDNPSCVNPDHLFLGTHADNMLDAAQKGKFRKTSEMSPRAKLSSESVRSIRVMVKHGMEQKVIAFLFDVTPQTVWKVVHGHRWANAA